MNVCLFACSFGTAHHASPTPPKGISLDAARLCGFGWLAGGRAGGLLAGIVVMTDTLSFYLSLVFCVHSCIVSSMHIWY